MVELGEPMDQEKRRLAMRTMALAWMGLAVTNVQASDLPAQTSPGVEQRELKQVDPDRFRVTPPVELDIPALPAMKAVADARLNVRQFTFSGNSAFDDAQLAAVIADVSGDITFAQLLDATRRISLFYRDQGYVVARAYVPEQEISDGIIDITVLEGLLGEVRFKGDAPITRERSARRMARLAESGVITEYDLEYGALLLNDLPGTTASVALQPGEHTGEADVEVALKDEGTFDVALDYNNFGNSVTGEHRFGAVIGINNLFDAGERFTFRPIISESGDTTYGSLQYDMPLFTSATRVGVQGSKLSSALGEEFEPLEIENEATSFGVTASHAFVRSRNKNLSGRFLYETRAFERTCGFCAASLINVIEDADYELDIIEFGIGGDWRDERAITNWHVNIRSGLSEVDERDAGVTIPGGDKIDGKFTSLRLGAQRLQRLTDLTTISAWIEGQFSGEDLDASERISLGGPGAVRAYQPSEALGDSGVVLQTELRRQFPSVTDRLGWLTGFEGYLLVDAGASELNDNYNNISRRLNETRSGWGAGLRLTGGSDFYIDLVAATRLADRESLVDQPDDDDTNFWAQAIYWF